MCSSGCICPWSDVEGSGDQDKAMFNVTLVFGGTLWMVLPSLVKELMHSKSKSFLPFWADPSVFLLLLLIFYSIFLVSVSMEIYLNFFGLHYGTFQPLPMLIGIVFLIIIII